jgi:phage gpG-like protein
MDARQEARILFDRILKDIQVELADEFDQNFEREAFFSESWARRRSPVRGGRSGHLLVDTGGLRGSIRSRIEGDSVFFSSDLPYAGIHNDGGDIIVTARMKRFFWAKYRDANGGTWGRGGNGGVEAEFWKMMALKKVGSTVRIPRRRFLGVNADVEKIVMGIVEENLRDYFENEFKIDIK